MEAETRKDVQVRGVADNRYVIVCVTRHLNEEGGTVSTAQSEHVAVNGAEAGTIISTFLSA